MSNVKIYVNAIYVIVTLRYNIIVCTFQYPNSNLPDTTPGKVATSLENNEVSMWSVGY